MCGVVSAEQVRQDMTRKRLGLYIKDDDGQDNCLLVPCLFSI